MGSLEISNTLSQLLTKHGLSEAALSRKVNLPRGTINRLVHGKTPDPRASTLEAIASFFNITVDQLLGKQPLSINDELINQQVDFVPIIAWNDLMDWREKISGLDYKNHNSWIPINPPVDESLFAVKLQGESMWPAFSENTVLIINPHKKAETKNFVLAYIKKIDEIVFRQLIIDGSFRILNASNGIFPPISLDDSDNIIGILNQTRNIY